MRKNILARPIALLLVLILALSGIAGAASIHGYARTAKGTYDGTYFYATTQGLNSGWSASNVNRFILHSTWIKNEGATTTKWVEVGYVDGAMQPPGVATPGYHKGFYTAYGTKPTSSQTASSYAEYKIVGPSTATGTNHAYQIQRTGTSSWNVYVDFNLYRTVNNFMSSANYVNVGLETNYPRATSNRWNERSFQVYKNGAWTNWTSGVLNNSGYNEGIRTEWGTQPTSIFTSKIA